MLQTPLHLTRSTPWQHYVPSLFPNLTHALREWLLYRQSMTQRLREHCHKVEVEVLQHQIHFPQREEAQMLGLKPRQCVLVREIIMHCDGSPWLYGRSIIPRDFMHGPNKSFAKLGSRPIGEILFSDRQIRRSTFEIAQLNPQHKEHQLLAHYWQQAPTHLWARRSQFYRDKQSLLLLEVFLPDMLLAIKKYDRLGLAGHQPD